MCSFQTTGLNYRWKNPKVFSQSSIASLWTRTLVLSFFHCQSSWSHGVFWKQTGGKVGWTSAGVGQLLRIGFHTVEPLPRLLVTVGLYYCNLINGKVFVGASFNSAIVSMDQKWLPPPAGSWRLLKPSLVGGENNLTGPHPPSAAPLRTPIMPPVGPAACSHSCEWWKSGAQRISPHCLAIINYRTANALRRPAPSPPSRWAAVNIFCFVDSHRFVLGFFFMQFDGLHSSEPLLRY